MDRYCGNIPVHQPSRPRTCFLVDNTRLAYKSSTIRTPRGPISSLKHYIIRLCVCFCNCYRINSIILCSLLRIYYCARHDCFVNYISLLLSVSFLNHRPFAPSMTKIYYESSTSLRYVCSFFLIRTEILLLCLSFLSLFLFLGAGDFVFVITSDNLETPRYIPPFFRPLLRAACDAGNKNRRACDGRIIYAIYICVYISIYLQEDHGLFRLLLQVQNLFSESPGPRSRARACKFIVTLSTRCMTR